MTERDDAALDAAVNAANGVSSDTLTDAALTPATATLSIKDQLRASRGGKSEVRQQLEGVKAKPGRPPGSSNKREQTEVPPSRAISNAELEREARRKKERQDQVVKQIVGPLNDQLMTFVMSKGMPPAAIYKDGKPPVPVESGKYTEFGARLAVDSFTANAIAMFAVELEGSSFGQGTMSKVTGGPVGLFLKGGLAAVCAIGYMQGVRELLKEMQPMMAAYAAAQENAKRQRENNK